MTNRLLYFNGLELVTKIFRDGVERGLFEYLPLPCGMGSHCIAQLRTGKRCRRLASGCRKIATEGIEDRLLLRAAGASSDKTGRRKQVEDHYDVLLYIGDNLRDFSEEFIARPGEDEEGQKNAIKERNRKVDANRQHWGVDWFVIPNPVYGEWQNLLGNNPRSKLRPTTMRRR